MKTFRILVLLCIFIGTTGYCVAAGSNSVPSFEELLKKKNPQADLKLIEAIKNSDVSGVKSVLAAGANPNWRYKLNDFPAEIGSDCSAIELAVETICQPAFFTKHRIPIHPMQRKELEKQEQVCVDILTLLFDAGANLRKADKDILYYPIWCGCASVVKLLLTNGADPKAKMLNDITPVELGEQYGHSSIVDILVRNGGQAGRLSDAAQLRFVRFAGESNIIGMARALENSAAVNEANKEGKTALISAVACRRYGIERYATVLYLLRKGANPNRHERKLKKTPLHILMMVSYQYPGSYGGDTHYDEDSKYLKSYFNHQEKVHQTFLRLTTEAILEAGAYVSARDEFGRTPFHMAAKHNNVEGAKILIKAGAKIMDRDNDGKTPLDYAESGEMIKLLKSQGAKEQ